MWILRLACIAITALPLTSCKAESPGQFTERRTHELMREGMSMRDARIQATSERLLMTNAPKVEAKRAELASMDTGLEDLIRAKDLCDEVYQDYSGQADLKAFAETAQEVRDRQLRANHDLLVDILVESWNSRDPLPIACFFSTKVDLDHPTYRECKNLWQQHAHRAQVARWAAEDELRDRLATMVGSYAVGKLAAVYARQEWLIDNGKCVPCDASGKVPDPTWAHVCMHCGKKRGSTYIKKPLCIGCGGIVDLPPMVDCPDCEGTGDDPDARQR